MRTIERTIYVGGVTITEKELREALVKIERQPVTYSFSPMDRVICPSIWSTGNMIYTAPTVDLRPAPAK